MLTERKDVSPPQLSGASRSGCRLPAPSPIGRPYCVWTNHCAYALVGRAGGADLLYCRAGPSAGLRPENGQPRTGKFPAGAVVGRSGAKTSRQNCCYSAKGPISRILSCAVIRLGAASPRTLISDLPGGFGPCLEHPCGAGPAPCTSLAPGSCIPPYLVLLRVGFTLTPTLTG